MTALYELAADFKAVATRLEEMELDDETIRDTLDGYAADFDNKVISIASLIRNLETTAEAIKQAEAQMAARRKTIESKAEWLRQYIINNMQATGRIEVDCPMFAIKVKTNRPTVVVAEDACIPSAYLRVTTSPDKKALKDALDAGEVIKGVSLVSSTTLSIK